MAYSTIVRLQNLRDTFQGLCDRVEALPASDLRGMAWRVLKDAETDLETVIQSGQVPNAGTGFRQGVASVEISAGYCFGAFVESAKVAAIAPAAAEDSLDSQLAIAASYVEAGMAVLLTSLEIGENPVTGLIS